MKIGFVNPPFDRLVLRCGYCSTFTKSNYYWPAVDFMVQGAFLLRQGHDVRIFDFNVMRTKEDEALREINAYHPEAVFCLVGAGSWRQDIKFIVALKRKVPEIQLVVGGAVLLYEAGYFLTSYPEIDGVLMDFTQDVLGEFFTKGKTNSDQISYRIPDGNRIGRQAQAGTFSHPIAPHSLFSLSSYRNPHRSGAYTVVLSSFGCPHNCTFCNTAKITFKTRPIEEVISEIRHIASLGLKEFKFRDLNFVTSPRRTREICEGIRHCGLGWHATTRADRLDLPTLAAMKKAGCHTLHIGVESGCDRILERHLKRTDKATIKQAFEHCRHIGIRTLATFIIGLPGETEDTIDETIRFAKELHCDYASFNIASPLYGTPLRRECIENNWYNPPEPGLAELETCFKGPMIRTPWLTEDQLSHGHRRAVRAFYMNPAYILRRLRAIGSPGELRAMIRMGLPLLEQVLQGYHRI